MTDAILVLNAGSSSLKFSLFTAQAAEPALVVGGQVGGIFTAPAFVARDAAGQTVGEKSWETGAQLGHDGRARHYHRVAADAITATTTRLAAVGHRVSHGGRTSRSRFASTPWSSRSSRSRFHFRRCTSRTTSPRSGSCSRANPPCPRSPASTTAMHRTQPVLEQMYALPRELDDAGVRRYGFHGISYEYIAGRLPACRRPRGARQDGGPPPGQRREHVRAGGGPQRRDGRWAFRRRRDCRWGTRYGSHRIRAILLT
jgi:acetate kinase